MVISGSSLFNIPTQAVSGMTTGNILPQEDTKSLEQRQDSSSVEGNSVYDFTRMSRREMSELIRSGEVVVDHFVLVLPEGGIDLTKDTKIQMDAAFDDKVDFLQVIQGRIEYRKSENMPTELLDKMLGDLEALQGEFKHTNIDVLA